MYVSRWFRSAVRSLLFRMDALHKSVDRMVVVVS